MKKIVKKTNYLFLSGLIFLLSFFITNRWGISVTNADVPPSCPPPSQQFTNGCFAPEEVAAWVASGGDGGGGAGDSSGS